MQSKISLNSLEKHIKNLSDKWTNYSSDEIKVVEKQPLLPYLKKKKLNKGQIFNLFKNLKQKKLLSKLRLITKINVMIAWFKEEKIKERL